MARDGIPSSPPSTYIVSVFEQALATSYISNHFSSGPKCICKHMIKDKMAFFILRVHTGESLCFR